MEFKKLFTDVDFSIPLTTEQAVTLLHSSAIMLVAVWRKNSGDMSSFSLRFLCALYVCFLCARWPLGQSVGGKMSNQDLGIKSGPSFCTLWLSLVQAHNPLPEIVNVKKLWWSKVFVITFRGKTWPELYLSWGVWRFMGFIAETLICLIKGGALLGSYIICGIYTMLLL